jgi:hypothetical protein
LPFGIIFQCKLQVYLKVFHKTSIILLYTVKKIDVIPGLFLIKSSWDCVKYFQRLEFYRKCCYIPGWCFSLLRM